jgi:hypothetical protein
MFAAGNIVQGLCSKNNTVGVVESDSEKKFRSWARKVENPWQMEWRKLYSIPFQIILLYFLWIFLNNSYDGTFA